MNAPFQSVGIIFLVTIVHVVAIAVYSSRTQPVTTVQRSIVVPDVDSIEVMPEQLVSELSSLKTEETDQNPDENADAIKPGKNVPVKKQERVVKETLETEKKEVTLPGGDAIKADKVVSKEAVFPETVSEEAVAAKVFKKMDNENRDDSDFTKRVSYPALDGIPGKKSKKLAENKPGPAPKVEVESSTGESARQPRSFSPIPRS